MQYRYFTKDKLNISLIGFGCMRFPILNNDQSLIDEKPAIDMLHFAIDNGINYIDTAYPYHQGKSEQFVGKALRNGLRDKIYLATKSPVWLVETYDDFEKYLDEQLDNLETDHIDFYLLHALHEKSFDKIVDLKVFDFLDEAKRKGKIKYVGFSFHDELPLFKKIVDSYSWDFCQIQLNYIDRQYQAGIDGMKYAKEKGLSVVIMEPIKGGKLATASKEIKEIWNESYIKRTPAEWALKWIYNFDEISVVLSGMSTIDQVMENIKTLSEEVPTSLSSMDLELVDRVSQVYKEKIKVGCTACEYCMPCPSNVSIPEIFDMYNNIYVYGTVDQSKLSYTKLQELGKDVSKCVECGVCENICPQHLSIISILKEAEKALI